MQRFCLLFHSFFFLFKTWGLQYPKCNWVSTLKVLKNMLKNTWKRGEVWSSWRSTLTNRCWFQTVEWIMCRSETRLWVFQLILLLLTGSFTSCRLQRRTWTGAFESHPSGPSVFQSGASQPPLTTACWVFKVFWSQISEVQSQIQPSLLHLSSSVRIMIWGC